MAQEIYNEGRVVGFSAWEIFAREAESKGIDPIDIPNEHKWLASMIGSGASMILRVPSGTTAGVHDYPLPTGSGLTASGVIVANPFIGNCEWDVSGFAKKVISYGPLIKNTTGSGNSPTSSNVPYGTDYSIYMDAIAEFMKITDGIVYIQNATWIRNQDNQPYKDIDPNYANSTTVIRLYISAALVSDVYILLTGFNNKVIIEALSDYAKSEGGYAKYGSTDMSNNDWKDGGMIGPGIVPWSNKIVFTVPSWAYSLINTALFTRTIPSDTSYTAKTLGTYIKFENINSSVKTNSLIDFNTVNPLDYYRERSFSTPPTLQENVTALDLGYNENYNALVAWYPGMTAAKIKAATNTNQIFPPALYAVKVTTTGTQTLVPIDTAAPGTVKCFDDPDVAYNYTQIAPNNFAIYHNPTSNSYSFVNKNDSTVNNWSGSAKINYAQVYPIYELVAGSTRAHTIALAHYVDGVYTEYGRNGANGVLTFGPSNNVCWNDMLSALSSNKFIDVLGTKLHALGNELSGNTAHPNQATIGMTNDNAVDYIGARWFMLNPGSESATPNPWVDTDSIWIGSEIDPNGDNVRYLTLNSGETPATIRLGENFIRFGNGLKLFILPPGSTPPTTNVPVGSIGIGW